MKKANYLHITFLFMLVTLEANGQVGKVGINTTMPQAMLHVKDSSVLFSGPVTLPGSPGNPPVSGAGTRMMWYPDKAAFRTGRVSGSEWNADNIGTYSFAVGYNSVAKGLYSIAMGNYPSALGNYSIAIGEAFTFGLEAVAIGANSYAFGNQSIALGKSTTAAGNYSIALGTSVDATGPSSMALGNSTVSSGSYSTSMGQATVASGANTFAMGLSTKANSYASFVIGRFNDTTSVSSTTWNVSDPLFIVGNGSSNTVRSNALTILKDGKIGIGTTNPGFLLNFPSDLGDKVSLWGSTGNHYGFGIQANLLQIHTDLQVSDIAFGWGRSTSFNETMRIRGNGNVGIGTSTPAYKLDVGSRMRIMSGGSMSNSAGTWLNKIDNSAVASFIGMYDDNYVGFYSALGSGWNFVMGTVSGNIGIGTVTPSAKLDVDGTSKLGTNGTAITEIIKVTVTKDVSNIVANSSVTETFAVANCELGSTVYISPSFGLADGLIIAYARVSAGGFVEAKFTNTTGSPINPLNMNYYITVIR